MFCIPSRQSKRTDPFYKRKTSLTRGILLPPSVSFVARVARLQLARRKREIYQLRQTIFVDWNLRFDTAASFDAGRRILSCFVACYASSRSSCSISFGGLLFMLRSSLLWPAKGVNINTRRAGHTDLHIQNYAQADIIHAEIHIIPVSWILIGE